MATQENTQIILGIETSCDETAAAVIAHTPTASNPYAAKILAQTVYSQFDEHECYGGVVPEIAARAHAERLPAIVKKTLQDANITPTDLTAIAATTGPGLVGALLMGSTFGKTLALAAQKPFIPTNHIEGHALTALLTENNLRPPYLLLLVSGGHCQLVHVKAVGSYTTLGSTLDDAIGECFDKVGKMFSKHDATFTHPYAPKVEAAAVKTTLTDLSGTNTENTYGFKLPQPKTENPLDFSFSGLKTAVRQALDKAAQKGDLTPDFIPALAAAFQHTAAQSLAQKTINALKQTGAIPLVVSGGVAVNQTIRTALKKVAADHQTTFHAPPLNLCADNAVMIAYTAALRNHFTPQTSNLASKTRPRWPLEEMTL